MPTLPDFLFHFTFCHSNKFYIATMKVSLYELHVLSQDGNVMAERCIAGNNYVEAKPGEEYKVKVTISHGAVDRKFPVQKSVAYLYIDGARVITYILFELQHWTQIQSGEFRGYPHNDDSFKAFLFAAPTAAKDYDNTESATGHVKVEFYEVERCLEQYGNLNDLSRSPPAAKQESENKKPTEQPSLRTSPGRIVPYQPFVPAPPVVRTVRAEPTQHSYVPYRYRAPSPPKVVYSWKRIRKEPDAVLELKCHIADTLDFIQAVYKAHLERIATNRVPVDLTAEEDAVVVVNPPAKPAPPIIDIEEESLLRIKVESLPSSSSASPMVGSGPTFSMGGATCETFDFALPAGSSAVDKPVLRLKNRASKVTKSKLKAAAVHAACTKRKAHAVAESSK